MHRNPEYIDQLLRGEIEAQDQDALHIALMNAAPQPDVEFVQSLADRLKTSPRESPFRNRRLRLFHSTRLLLSATFVLVVIVSSVFGLSSLLRQVISHDSGLNAVMESGLGTELSLIQISGDFTVEIQWAYADTNRLSIGYVITASGPELYTNLTATNVVLRDSNGNIYDTQPVGLTLIGNNEASGLLVADFSHIANLPSELHIYLEMQVQYITASRRTEIPIPENVDLWFMSSDMVSFEFAVPIQQGSILKSDLISESSGVLMTLREFSAAPSGGSAVVCYPVTEYPEEDGWEWSTNLITLSHNDETVADSGHGRRDAVTGCERIQLDATIPSTTGTWTLSIGEISGVRTHLPDDASFKATVEASGGSVQPATDDLGIISLPDGADEMIGLVERIEGRWIFSFEIPEISHD